MTNAIKDMTVHELLDHARENFPAGTEVVYMYSRQPVLIGWVLGAPYLSEDGDCAYVRVEVRWQNSKDFPHWPDDGYNVRYVRAVEAVELPAEAVWAEPAFA